MVRCGTLWSVSEHKRILVSTAGFGAVPPFRCVMYFTHLKEQFFGQDLSVMPAWPSRHFCAECTLPVRFAPGVERIRRMLARHHWCTTWAMFAACVIVNKGSTGDN